jgi:extracellular factor (EF) 3-hydroxypalmitic acid methyl ester biosynthesis protein
MVDLSRSARDPAVSASTMFVDLLVQLDRRARRERRTLPTPAERRALHTAFWNELIPALADAEVRLGDPGRLAVQQEVQDAVNPWLLRSRLWARSWIKPHGYPGDYRILEWMYDLERDGCADPCQPAAVNLLDGLYRSVHSVRAVWHRRAWFSKLIEDHIDGDRASVRVLDVACGGSRYVRDVLERAGPRSVHATFFDQDPAAIAFVQSRLPDAARRAARFVCAPVSQISDALPRDGHPRFDVAVSTGLFDYLPAERAREVLLQMAALTRPGGTVAICNFSPDDRSRVVKECIAAWSLTYRTASEVAELFPAGTRPAVSHSPDGGLIYARARTGEGGSADA